MALLRPSCVPHAHPHGLRLNGADHREPFPIVAMAGLSIGIFRAAWLCDPAEDDPLMIWRVTRPCRHFTNHPTRKTNKKPRPRTDDPDARHTAHRTLAT